MYIITEPSKPEFTVYLLLSSSIFSLLLFSASSCAMCLAFSWRSKEFWDSRETSWDLMVNSPSDADLSFSTATASCA